MPRLQSDLFPVCCALLISVLLACSHSSTPKYYGEVFDTMQVISVTELLQQADHSAAVTVKGTVTSSCQAEGCWLNLSNPGGKDVYVDWDEKFHVPHDISGRTVFVHGHTYIDTLSEGRPVAFRANGIWL